MKIGKKNIAFLLPDFSIGGAENQVTLLLNEISSDDSFKVFLIIIGRNFKHKISDNIEVLQLKSKKGKIGKIKELFKIVNYVKKNKINYLHGFLGTGMIWSTLITFFAKETKNIICFRAGFSKPNFFRKIFNKIFFNNAYAVTTNNKYVKHNISKNLGLSSNIIKYIPNGIGLNKSNIEKSYPSSIKRIVVPGSIKFVKNQLSIIHAVSLMEQEQKEKLKITFIGKYEIEYYENMVKIINEYKLNDTFSHISYLKKKNIYKNCDAIILPSFYEGFANVLLEAMFYGKLILVSLQAEQNNVIKNNYNGFLFDANSPESQKNSIIKALKLSKKDIYQMCYINRKTVLENYSIDKISAYWKDLYN